MKKFLSIVLALAMILALAACGAQGGKDEPQPTDFNAKSEGVMTYADYAKAAENDEVIIEAYVQQAAYNAEYGNVSMFLQDPEGGYFVYRMNCTAEDAAKFTQGAKLQIKGYKTAWAGEVEIADATYTIMESEAYVAEAADVSAIMGDSAALEAKMNTFIAIKGAVVTPSLNAEGETAAFLYNWDGSGKAGSNNDLYFNVEIGGNVYNLCVESDECPESSDVYQAVTKLAVGDKVDLEGFLYWYNGANPHISSCKVAEASKFAVGGTSAADFAAAAIDSEVTVTGYIQETAYAEAYGNISMFVQNAEGGFYVYRMNCTADDAKKLVDGAKVTVTGYKSEWAGEVEIADVSSFTVEDGSYIAAPVDVTAIFSNETLLEKHMNEKIALNGLVIEASKNPALEDVAFLYNWDGSGAEGNNNDLYFNASIDGMTFNFVVESDECPEGSDVYKAVQNLKIGDTIDAEGMLYWYNGANPHINAVTVK